MKTQIARSLSAAALAITLLSGSTAAFAATPATSTAFYDDAAETGEEVASGLDYGAAALGVGGAVVDAAAGNTIEGQATADGLNIGATAVGGVAAPIVRIATR